MNSQDTSWIRRFMMVGSLADLKAEIAQAAERLQFQHYVYRARFPNLRTGYNEICLDNCPAGWRKHYLRHGAAIGADGSALRIRTLQQVTPILWRELLPHHPALMKKAREFGLGTGVILPVHGPAGQWAALSLIKTDSSVEAERGILATMAESQLLATYVHEASARIIRRRLDRPIAVPQPAPDLDLSDRERQILALAAKGKTAAEIGKTLDIAERTVGFHMTNIRRKLGAASSPHAVVRAVSLGLIAGG